VTVDQPAGHPTPPPVQQPVKQQAPAEALDILALIFALVGLSLVGLLCGVFARNQAREQGLRPNAVGTAGLVIGAIGCAIWSLITLPFVIVMFGASSRGSGGIIAGFAGFLLLISLVTLIGWSIHRLMPSGRAQSHRFQTVLVLACAGMGTALVVGGLSNVGSEGWAPLPGMLVGLLLAGAPFAYQKYKVGKLQGKAQDQPSA
jgi:hypothetical protein